MRMASIWHSRDGYALAVERTPWWAYTLENAWFQLVCPASGHFLCSPPEWTWHVGFGRDRHPNEDARFDHRWSLGKAMYDFTSAVGAFGSRHTAVVVKIPLSREYVHRNFPESVVDWDSEDPDLSPDAARWSPEEPGH